MPPSVPPLFRHSSSNFGFDSSFELRPSSFPPLPPQPLRGLPIPHVTSTRIFRVKKRFISLHVLHLPRCQVPTLALALTRNRPPNRNPNLDPNPAFHPAISRVLQFSIVNPCSYATPSPPPHRTPAPQSESHPHATPVAQTAQSTAFTTHDPAGPNPLHLLSLQYTYPTLQRQM